MMMFEQWQGQEPVMMVPTQRHQPCAVQSRQLAPWDSSCSTWDDYEGQQQQGQQQQPQQQLNQEQQQQHCEQQQCDHQQRCGSMKASGCKRGGRPVTWIGGGGMDPKKLAGLGVPVLRTLFHQVFGQETASNNAAWLRRKLAEAPDSVHGQRRSPVVRARDSGAAIWNQDGLPEGEEDGQLLEGHMQEDADTDGHNQHNQQQHHQQAAGHDMQQRSSLQQGGSVFASAGLEGASTSGHQMQVDFVPQGGGRLQQDGRGGSTPPRSPVAGLMINNTSTVHHSPGGTALGKRGRSNSSKKAQQQPLAPWQQSAGCYGTSGVTLGPETMCDSLSGHKVLVYWPADQQWWEATLCRVNTAARQLQLLYADMTEEVLSGRDYDDLLVNGHLLDVSDAAPAPQGGSPHLAHNMVPLDKAQSAPGPLAQVQQYLAGQPGSMQDSLSGFCDTNLGQGGGPAAAAAAAARSQSCMLPLGSVAAAATATAAEVQAEVAAGASAGAGVSAAVTHNSSRRSTRDGAHFSLSGASGSGGSKAAWAATGPGNVSGSGNTSGNNSQGCTDPQEEADAGVATKRQCFELSGNTSDAPAETANPAAEGCSSIAPAAGGPAGPTGQLPPGVPSVLAQQQQGVGDSSKLGLWFANQQLQQLHLQEQVQHNMELQQQAHLQMQQQMAAHLQMHMAGRFMQQQMAAAAAAPLSFAGAAVAAAAASGMFGSQAPQGMSTCFDVMSGAVSTGFPMMNLPAISAPPNALAMQQLVCSSAGPAAAGPSTAFGSPTAAVNGMGCNVNVPNGSYGQQLQTLQHFQQEAAQLAVQLLEPTSPLAQAAAAAAAAATWPGLAAAGPAGNSPVAAMAAMAAAAAMNSPRGAVPCYSPSAVQPVQPAAVYCSQQALGASMLPASAGAGVSGMWGQLPLPNMLPQPVASMQPALPDGPSAAPAAGSSAAAAAAAAAAPAPKAVKSVRLQLEPEVTPMTPSTQSWMDKARDAANCTAGQAAEYAAAGAKGSFAGVKCEGAGAVDADESCGPFVPAISGATAGCVSGFTGGVQGLEALDEVDTLLSRPEEGLFSDLDACSKGVSDCKGGDTCWGLLGMSGASSGAEGFARRGSGPAEDEEDAGFSGGCQQGPGSSSCSQGAGEGGASVGCGDGGFQLPMFSSQDLWGGGQGLGACGVVKQEETAAMVHRPNSALAHVFDYA